MCSSTHFFNDRECFIRVTSSLGRCRFSLVYSIVVVVLRGRSTHRRFGSRSSNREGNDNTPLIPPAAFAPIPAFA